MPRETRVAAIVILLALVSVPAFAKVSVQVEFGWEKVYKAGAWSPVFVTAVDPEAAPARLVQLELSMPYDRIHSLNLRKTWTIGQTPTTTVVYAPLGWLLDETVIVVRDLESGRKLYEDTLEPRNLNGPQFNYESLNRGDLLVGVSGRGQAMNLLQGKLTWTRELVPSPNASSEFITRLRTGYVSSRLLPEGVIGFDGLDLLVLNAPDLSGGLRGMSESQQRAIVEWVRAGGRLLLWAGDGSVPEQSALGKALPCRVGAARLMELSEDARKKWSIASTKVTAQSLEPLPGAQRAELLDGAGQIISGRCGMGEIAVLSFDAAQLSFGPGQNSQNDPYKRFWQGVLAKVLRDDLEGLWDERVQYAGAPDSVDARRLQAMSLTVERLGNVPGVGSFDFTYIAIVVLGMMAIVGPVDWFVLRKLGKQPWTWVTMSGWIVLITTGAIYLGALVKSGDLHYRTLRLIDQADQTVVAAIDVAGIYSPKTQSYGLDGPADAWWRPAQLDAPTPWNRGTPPTQLALGQDGRGQKPLELVRSDGSRMPTMTVNVWNLKFLESRLGDASAIKPMIEAKLKADLAGNVSGTIRNIGDRPISRVAIHTTKGVALAEQLDAAGTVVPLAVVQPGQTVRVRAALRTREVSTSNNPAYVNYNGPVKSYRRTDGPPALWEMLDGADLAAERSERIDWLLRQNPKLACVIAEAEGTDPYFKLTQSGNIPAQEKHWLLIRALVEME